MYLKMFSYLTKNIHTHAIQIQDMAVFEHVRNQSQPGFSIGEGGVYSSQKLVNNIYFIFAKFPL